MLEKILEDVGLRKGQDYILQGEGMGLKDSDGKHQKPDVIVNLPDEKHVVIDSKVSLTAYERFFNEREDDMARASHLKAHLVAVKERVKELETRRYQDTQGLGTPDFVLMFIPIESAYMLALQEDRGLHEFAWNKGVAIVCPSTLFSSLSTIASLWKLALQNQNAEEIARKGGALYDKFAGFVNDMEGIGKNIKTLETSYGNAMNKLSEGRGNLLRQAETLKEMGAKATKSLPAQLVKKDATQENEVA
jgi:DNA recombination protein RmuC